jgi:ABC-type nitrate/sulfonate/bicarbonate transport system substrate-binding protein
MVRFVRANNEAIDFINANRQESAEILAKSSSVSIDDALKTHDMVLKVRGFNRDSSVKQEGIKGILDVLVDFGDIKDPKSITFYYDDKYVKAASTK